MRGKALDGRFTGPCYRITPAHAGKSDWQCPLSGSCRDHPRMCGEKSRAGPVCGWCPGSPPHVRGKEASVPPIRTPIGITPAHAGKSTTRLILSVLPKDHPRACGEKSRVCLFLGLRPGSPPRMRGKGGGGPRRGAALRITPAHAGKRLWPSVPATGRRDHPRACGEKLCV